MLGEKKVQTLQITPTSADYLFFFILCFFAFCSNLLQFQLALFFLQSNVYNLLAVYSNWSPNNRWVFHRLRYRLLPYLCSWNSFFHRLSKRLCYFNSIIVFGACVSKVMKIAKEKCYLFSVHLKHCYFYVLYSLHPICFSYCLCLALFLWKQLYACEGEIMINWE